MLSQIHRPCWAWALEGKGSSSHGSSSSSSHHTARTHGRHRSKPANATPRDVCTHSVRHQGPHHVEAGSESVSSNRQHGLVHCTTADAVQYGGQAPHSFSNHRAPRHLQDQPPQLQHMPNQALFQQIKACTCWPDCLELLKSHAASLDAMLLSTLCTHTVYLYELQQYNLSGTIAATSGSDGTGSATCRQPRARSSRPSSSLGDKAAYRQYMSQLADGALHLATSGTFRGQQYSNVLWCFARCRHRLTVAWINQYLLQAQQHLMRFDTRNLAQLIWATAALKSQPPSSFLDTFLAASGSTMQWFTAQDLANTVWGLATLGVQPPPSWLHRAVAASSRCWSGFKPFELSITIWGFAKLGLSFRGSGFQPATQQQQHQQQRSAAGAAHVLHAAGFGWLLDSIALLTPAMGLQEVANLLWGLAVGNAALTTQQTQALGSQACIILAQSLSSNSQAFTSALTVSLWALSRLAWAPTLPQARILVRLTAEALCGGALDMKHACILVFSLGRLQLRPPQAAMQQLMCGLASGLPAASIADVLQVLTGCKLLGWRIDKPWWGRFYEDSLGALRQGNAAELVHLLATIAYFRPVKPTAAWWEVWWDSMGVELEATVAACGLSRIVHTRNLPKGNITIAAAPLKAARKRDQRRVLLQLRRRRLAAVRGNKSLGAEQLLSAEWDCVQLPDGPHPLAWSLMAEALQIVTNLQSVVQQHHTHPEQQQQQYQRGQVGVTPARAVVLLWAATRLKRCPPKVLLWQLLLLVLVGVHSLPSPYLAVALWAVGHLLHHFGRGWVECFKLIHPLALVAQWRLMNGLAGSSKLERGRVMTALRYLASEDGRLMSSMLLLRATHSSENEVQPGFEECMSMFSVGDRLG